MIGHRMCVGLGALVAALALVACGSGGTTDSGEPIPIPAQDLVEEDPGREIIRTADMSMRVDDVRESVRQIKEISERAGGRIANERISTSGEALFADITARVPADRLDAVIEQIGDLGTVTALNVLADDVTAQGIDLDARIAALQTSVDRLRDLLAQATTTKDLIEVEGELTARQAELDSLLAQRAALSDLVALSTLSVSLSPSSEAAAWTPPGFLSGLESGWNALRTTVAGIITVAGFALPFLVVVAVIAALIVAVIILLNRRKRTRQEQQGATRDPGTG